MSLANVAQRLPSLVHRLLPFPKVQSERGVAPHICGPPCGGEEEAGKEPDASVTIMDSQSVKTTEEGAGRTATMPTRKSKVESGTCWLTP
jgi:hypothetical protein